MRLTTPILALLACLISTAGRADVHESALLSALLDLGRLNGEALACDDHEAAALAKAKMLAYAPKVRRYGAAYEQGTQEGFAARIRKSAPCRPEADVLADVDNAAIMLRLETERDPRAGAGSP